MHAGTGTVEGITRNVSEAQPLADDIERLLEGRSEVERVVQEGSEGPVA
jgi:hypothetical protein